MWECRMHPSARLAAWALESGPMLRFVTADLPMSTPALLIKAGELTIIAIGPAWDGLISDRIALVNALLAARKQGLIDRT